MSSAGLPTCTPLLATWGLTASWCSGTPLFTGSRAPTTLGTHLRAYTFGHVRQLDAVASRVLVNLAGRAPNLLAVADQVAYLDIDDTIRATHGYAKQGAGYGYTKVKGLNVQLATVATPTAAPVIAGTRLRKGNTACGHGAPRLIADAAATAKKAGATGLLTVRADAAYYSHAVIAAARGAARARFSVTCPPGSPTAPAACTCTYPLGVAGAACTLLRPHQR